MSRNTARFFLFALIAATVACDKVALLAPTGSTVTLSISSTSVASNGTADVIAAVIESSGTPVHNGTEVTFQASVGQVDPVVVRTEGGIARTTFRANGASGTAKITAFSGGARATDIDVLVGGAAASTVSVRTSPTSVTQNGNPVEVVASIRDVSGNPLPGAQVVFTADNGSLSSSSAVSDSNGEARVTLTTNRQTIVTASVAGKEGRATINVVNNPTISVSASPTNPNVGTPTVFTITPGATLSGNAISNVNFDPGDGSPTVNLGPISSPTTRSHIYARADQYTATAVVTDISGLRGQGSTTVSVGRAIPTVNISGPTSVTAGETATFTVTSTAGTGGPPLTAVRVAFSDGIVRDVQPGTATVSREFSAAGTYEATAVASDQAGTQSSTARTSVVVRSRAPLEVNIDASDTDPAFTTDCQPTGFYPKTCTISPAGFGSASTTVRVQFSATVVGVSSTDPVIRYVWNFGDGSPPETSARGTDHVFTRGSLFGPATYTVTVTVTTASGATGTGRVTLIIQ